MEHCDLTWKVLGARETRPDKDGWHRQLRKARGPHRASKVTVPQERTHDVGFSRGRRARAVI